MLGDALVEAVWGGGYPEALARTAPRRRTAWARQYLEALNLVDDRAGNPFKVIIPRLGAG